MWFVMYRTDHIRTSKQLPYEEARLEWIRIRDKYNPLWTSLRRVPRS